MMQSIRDRIANDAYAITFQTMGQYRTALLKAVDALAQAGEQEPSQGEQRECNACDWKGSVDDCVYCGSVGPLCPKCNETTDRQAQGVALSDEIAQVEGALELCEPEDQEAFQKIKRALSRASSSRADVESFGYSALFNAIAAAVEITTAGHIGISVEKFRAALRASKEAA